MKPVPAPLRPPATARGSIVVLGIFGVGLALALFALWWNVGQNQRCVALWGQDNFRLIRKAPQVELWELVAKEGSAINPEDIEIDQIPYRIAARHDISQARGLVHARHALTEDASFEWGPPSNSNKTPRWEFSLFFQEGTSSGILLIDTAGNRVRLLESDSQAMAIPRIIAGWKALIDRERAANSGASR